MGRWVYRGFQEGYELGEHPAFDKGNQVALLRGDVHQRKAGLRSPAPPTHQQEQREPPPVARIEVRVNEIGAKGGEGRG